jgi:hypothetical protein
LRRLATEVEKQRNLFCPNKPPKRSLGGSLATQHVHAEVADLYPEALPAVGHLRSARDLLSQISHSFEYGAVRFLIGGFTSTAGYVPGNEAQACA